MRSPAEIPVDGPIRHRWIFPTGLVRCPHCGHLGFRHAGGRPGGSSGEMRYCRCTACTATFPLLAIAVEEGWPDGSVRVRPLRPYTATRKRPTA